MFSLGLLLLPHTWRAATCFPPGGSLTSGRSGAWCCGTSSFRGTSSWERDDCQGAV
ncbi:hypothetical protein GLYMA_09G195502v4 [Glycine max]|nr:hypothetical protein GLYMA_09G195502v4 [Glycine max]